MRTNVSPARPFLTRPVKAAISFGLVAVVGCGLPNSDAHAAPPAKSSSSSESSAAKSRDLPRTADSAERWLRSTARKACVKDRTTRWKSLPRTADSAERMLANC